MKAVFMGTPEIAAVILESIVSSGVNVAAVITQTDKPKGRGNAMSFPAVKVSALKLNIPVYQPVKVKNKMFLETLKEINPDIILVAAYGKILPKTILDLPKYGCLCVHASLLPKYRGAAPIQWAIMNGEKTSGITIIYMNEGIDTGDMILKKEVAIDQKETAGSLHDKLAVLGAEALLETIQLVSNDIVTRTPQDDSLSCYAPILDKSIGLLDFSKSAQSLERLIRGLNPWPSAYTYYNGKLLKIWDADVCTDSDILSKALSAAHGRIVSVDKNFIYVSTGEGVLKICELQPEGKKRMPCSEFLKGNQVLEGIQI